jgi:glyoxylase I family protein
MTIQRIVHIGICVRDPERSIRFYRDGLGFTYLSDLRIAGESTATMLQIPDLDLHAYYLERNGVRIELLHYLSPGTVGSDRARPMNQLGFANFAVHVTNLPDTVAHLRACGARVLEGTRIENPAFRSTVIFVTDPDGRLIELVETPGQAQGERESTMKSGRGSALLSSSKHELVEAWGGVFSSQRGGRRHAHRSG